MTWRVCWWLVVGSRRDPRETNLVPTLAGPKVQVDHDQTGQDPGGGAWDVGKLFARLLRLSPEDGSGSDGGRTFAILSELRRLWGFASPFRQEVCAESPCGLGLKTAQKALFLATKKRSFDGSATPCLRFEPQFLLTLNGEGRPYPRQAKPSRVRRPGVAP